MDPLIENMERIARILERLLAATWVCAVLLLALIGAQVIRIAQEAS